jgi:hypothetical protein
VRIDLPISGAFAANTGRDVMVQKVFAQLDQFLQGEPQSDDQALLAMEITE